MANIKISDLTGASAAADANELEINEAGTSKKLTVAQVSSKVISDIVTADITALGALMDSEVDADIKTLVLPASTTISAFGATLIDDAAATNARTTLGVAIGSDVQAYDADTLKADTSDTLTAGFDSDEQDLGTISSGTTTLEVDAANEENFKKCVNGGAFVLSPPSTSSSCVIVLRVTNNSSAGAITFTGFTVQDGDDLTTTDGDDFFITVIECGGFSSATVKALQ
jgi:hypothetical protein